MRSSTRSSWPTLFRSTLPKARLVLGQRVGERGPNVAQTAEEDVDPLRRLGGRAPLVLLGELLVRRERVVQSGERHLGGGAFGCPRRLPCQPRVDRSRMAGVIEQCRLELRGAQVGLCSGKGVP
jgi:hypothetical protein